MLALLLLFDCPFWQILAAVSSAPYAMLIAIGAHGDYGGMTYGFVRRVDLRDLHWHGFVATSLDSRLLMHACVAYKSSRGFNAMLANI
ncbi:hypothetical protein DHEL01_v212996 [Diaporthe helianthi]|uniref:Uncharacterized protein n=1 Tax=Diaporthe helianthi TaxID=158607 RepID=A0A2P5HEE4_DIAHE|nr:hypothetical protein DHEL01_v212996 [Diaporthe helianthi]